MAQRSTIEASVTMVLDRRSRLPLHRQLYEGVRENILEGRLSAGVKLPSTRALSSELGVSRNTVMNAFLQLVAEGYLEGQVGSGTYVSRSLPDELLRAQFSTGSGHVRGLEDGGLSERGATLAAARAITSRDHGAPRAFRPCIPALDAFPFEIWERLVRRRWRRRSAELLGYGHPAGYRPLREGIADYLGASRAVRCSWEQVIVVSGSQQGLDLAAKLLLDPGDAAWIEDPGYVGARAALVGVGARLVPVPVDGEGIDVAAGERIEPGARLAYVTPSHQYPSGVTMSLPRRLRLLEWAKRTGARVVEDDYDSEYRYSGRPLEALQGLDSGGQVIYVGTFSKVLFPSLRLGYLVVPENLVDAFCAARALSDRHSPIVEQAVLTDFIVEGHFSRHMRRMRTLYAERQTTLVEAAGRELAGILEVRPAEAGMHLVGRLPEGADDLSAARRAYRLGVEAPALSAHAMEPLSRGGLLLGYTAVDTKEIHEGVGRLRETLTRNR